MNYDTPAAPPTSIFDKMNVLYITWVIITIISIIVTIVIIYLSLRLKLERSFTNFLIINLWVVNLIHTISYILNSTYEYIDPSTEAKVIKLIFDSDFFCQLQAFTLISSSMSQEFLITSITLIVYWNFIKEKKITKMTLKLFIHSILVCYGIPIYITWLYWVNNILGMCELNCWWENEESKGINHSSLGLILYGIKWINIAVSIYLTIEIVLVLKKIDNEEIKKYANKMLFYPWIQIIGALIPTIYTIWLGMNIKEAQYLEAFTLVSGSIQGWLYPLCYLYNTKFNKPEKQRKKKEKKFRQNQSMAIIKSLATEDNNDISENILYSSDENQWEYNTVNIDESSES